MSYRCGICNSETATENQHRFCYPPEANKEIAALRKQIDEHKELRDKIIKDWVKEKNDLVSENAALREELKDIKDSFAVTVAEKCDPKDDRVHCTCVPALRRKIEELNCPSCGFPGVDTRRYKREMDELAKWGAAQRRMLVETHQEVKISYELHIIEQAQNARLGSGYPQGPCSCDDCQLYRRIGEALALPVPPAVEAVLKEKP